MTTQEFSDQFDVLLNSSFIANDFGEQSDKIDIQLDEYEKSVFLTQAQEQLVINLYNGRNIEGLSFESAEESRRYLKELTKTEVPTNITKVTTGLYPNSYKVDMSAYGNLLFVTRETVKFAEYVPTTDTTVVSGKSYYNRSGTSPNYIYTLVVNPTGNSSTSEYYEKVEFKPWQIGSNLIVEVVPITQDEYHRIKRNPYKKFNDERVLRIENNNEWYLYSKYALKDYSIDYIRKPKPIIVSAIGDMTIDGYRSTFDLSSDQTNFKLVDGKYYKTSDTTSTTDENTNVITVTVNNGANPILNASECELNPILHRTILLEAVKLAKIVKQNQIRNEMLGNMPGQLVHPPMQPVNQRPN